MRFVLRQHRPIKVTIVAGFGTVEPASEALKESAAGFIAKPFKKSGLTDLILEVTIQRRS